MKALKLLSLSLLVTAILQSCSNNPVSVAPSDQAMQDNNATEDVTTVISTVSYSKCAVHDNGDIVITLDPTCTYAQLQLHNHPNMPYYHDYELSTDFKISVWYDYTVHKITVCNPTGYIDDSYEFKIIQFCQ